MAIGHPIYGQIQAFNLTNVLVVVVRIFGGTKLGVGGLIQAYRASAKLALESSTIIEKLIENHFKLEFDYSEMEKVMRIIKQHPINLVSQELTSKCKFIIAIRKNESALIVQRIKEIHTVTITDLIKN